MITLTKEEAQQVLDALVFATPSGYGPTEVYKDSIVLLQNRLAKETPYEVGQRLYRQGLGISDIPTAVYSDSDIAEAYRGFEDARLTQPEPEPVADKYLMEVECTKCGAKQDGILTVNAPPQPEPSASVELVAWNEAVEKAVTDAKYVFKDSCNHTDQAIEFMKSLMQSTYHLKDDTAPPQRKKWQGLTAAEMMALFPRTNDILEKRIAEFACAIEAKLKEKNT